MTKDNSLFETLNWIFKVKKEHPKQEFESNFMLNRWISMSMADFALAVNATGNRWNKVLTEIPLKKFYYSIFPKYTKRISYIKKINKQTEEKDILEYAYSMEISSKDVLFLENALAEMNNLSK